MMAAQFMDSSKPQIANEHDLTEDMDVSYRVEQAPLLDICGLTVSIETQDGVITPVEDVALRVARKQTVALVGESGCGKSITAQSILRLLPQPPFRMEKGEIFFARLKDTPAIDLLKTNERTLREVRGGQIAMVFQDPMTSLNPVFRIGEQIVETIELHQGVSGQIARAQAIELLRRVGIAKPEQRVDAYPHELSGGMRQRAMIAMALSCHPKLLIADEPTTALDVTIQRQILDLLRSIQIESNMSLLLITHNLGVVAEIADYVYVMYAGRIVEHGDTTQVLANPMHPYTQGLLRCVPKINEKSGRLDTIPGTVPSPSSFPTGCRFHPRCELTARLAASTASGDGISRDSDRDSRSPSNLEAQPACLRRCALGDETSTAPPLRKLNTDHYVACWESENVTPLGNSASNAGTAG